MVQVHTIHKIKVVFRFLFYLFVDLLGELLLIQLINIKKKTKRKLIKSNRNLALNEQQKKRYNTDNR